MARVAKNINYDEVIEVNKQVTKIQAFFRGKLAIKKIEQLATTMRQTVKMEMSADPDEYSLKEYVT